MWKTPKTDWGVRYDTEGNYVGDYFNVADYNRIKDNIDYLYSLACRLYKPFEITTMKDVTIGSYGYASTFDALDANLETLAVNTFRPSKMQPVKHWIGNQPPPTAQDLNRIEETCAIFKNVFEMQAACQKKLPYQLKGSVF